MHAPAQFLADLTLTIAGGVCAGWIARKLGLHPILGYVLAGIVVGPFTPGYITQVDNLNALSELGLVFLMFTIGLEFKFAEIRALGARPILLSFAAMALIAVAGGVGAIVLRLPHHYTIALILLLSSTAIGIALMRDAGLINERVGRLAVSILIVQDLVAILLLVLIGQPLANMSPVSLLQPLGITALFVVLALTLGRELAKRLIMRTLAKAPGDEHIAVFAGIALVAAYLSHLVGLSFAFGAFVAGAVVSELPESAIVEHVVAPFKDLFVLCFFVAIGSLIDPRLIVENWGTVLLLGIAVVVVRFAIWWAFARTSGFDQATAVLMGVAMIPLGEFNVVLAQVAQTSQRIDATELATCVGVMFISVVLATLAHPFAMRASQKRRQQTSHATG